MVLRTVNLSDTIDQWKTQHNSLATDVGDLSLLNTADSSSLVAAINELIGEFDSSAIVRLSRNSLSVSPGITYDSSTGVIGLSIPANTITFTMMTDSSVGVSELRNNAVTTVKLVDNAVTTVKILDNAITFDKMADSSVGVSELRNNAVTTVKILDNAVTTSKILDNAITFAKMADSSVGSNELRQAIELIIYNSAGTALKTMYGAGE